MNPRDGSVLIYGSIRVILGIASLRVVHGSLVAEASQSVTNQKLAA